jgi:hypothetical protein
VRKDATSRGRTQRSRGTKSVGAAGQEKRWLTVCGEVLQFGQEPSVELSMNSL